MDADIVWPDISQYPVLELEKGKLYGPRRRILPNIPLQSDATGMSTGALIPQESDWKKLRLHNTREFSGWTQIFHAEDPHIPAPGHGPWFETNWKHAGGADSYFHMRWAEEDKVRLPWEVLHLGQHGANWCGRTLPYTDGTEHSDVEAHRHNLQRLIQGRRAGVSNWQSGWKGERL